MIPPAERQRHASCACFNQPPREQEMLHQLRAAIVAVLRITFAVTRADLRIFFLNIERFDELARSQHSERLLIESIQAIHQAALIHIAAELAESAQQIL